MSLLSNAKSFGEAFPAVVTVSIEVRIKKGGPMDGHPTVVHFSNASPPGEYVECVKHGCVGGGWCIGDVLRDMVSKGETHRTTGGICKGRERMSRSNFRACLADFEAEIDLAYKSEGEKRIR
jgi:hypothetical protein